MKNGCYTARIVQNYGRTGWAVEFRHPMLYKAGRPGRKVRKGLDVTDEKEAERLVAELNELLADKSFHAVSAVHRARQRFSAKIGEIFYKNLKSEFAVFQGTRFVGSHRPIMVVTANAAIPGKGPPLSEHFVFYTPSPGSCPNREVCRSTLYTCDNEGSQSLGLDFPNLMTIEAMISGESQMGRDHFANHVWEKDKTLHKQLFWPDAPGESLDFQRLEDAPLVIMLYSSPFASEIQWMLAVTENQSLRELQYQLKQLSNFKLQQKQIG